MAYDYSLLADEDTKQYLKLKEENKKLKKENEELDKEVDKRRSKYNDLKWKLVKIQEENRMLNLEEENKDLWEENTFLKHLRRENEECIEQQKEKIKLLESRVHFLEWIIDQKTRDWF